MSICGKTGMKQQKRASFNSALAHCSRVCWSGNASVACRCTAKPTAGMVLSQVFKAHALRHPAAADTFVPNDVQLGGGQAPFILLTGETPTTCLRYTLLAMLLARCNRDACHYKLLTGSQPCRSQHGREVHIAAAGDALCL